MQKIISGGQTGADRAALDWAIAHHLPHGGFCPKGRVAEDGPIDPKYNLTEIETVDYSTRTEKNVVESDGTLIVTMSGLLTGGTLDTLKFARKHKKPALQIHPHTPDPAGSLRYFLGKHEIKVLNVAGPRASKEDVAAFTGKVLDMMVEADEGLAPVN